MNAGPPTSNEKSKYTFIEKKESLRRNLIAPEIRQPYLIIDVTTLAHSIHRNMKSFHLANSIMFLEDDMQVVLIFGPTAYYLP
ncbi:hypothetical protein L1987_11630 [Smallanthus sonchifolius]|uniref:Uncharacterized protein n=1 Tax=Smallanthus sonchifolius TaxID=185202 RepID=A0ACB9JCF3_9ASTR|nr:hypothetical protein L1987_11630 [Smallanthus sonchifolius]